MIDLPGCIGQGSFAILSVEIGAVGLDLLAGLTCGIEMKDVLHSDPQAADAGPATALIRVVGDAVGHGSRLSASAGWVAIRVCSGDKPLGRRELSISRVYSNTRC
jgi:hypothetical protein